MARKALATWNLLVKPYYTVHVETSVLLTVIRYPQQNSRRSRHQQMPKPSLTNRVVAWIIEAVGTSPSRMLQVAETDN